MSSIADVLLVGYGAVGVIYAYILTQSKHVRVTAVARGNYIAAQDHGININSAIFGVVDGFKPYRVVRSVEEAADRQYAYVIVTTKALPELSPTPTILAPLLSATSYKFPQPTYVLLQNGLGVEDDLYRKASELGTPKIITAAVFINTNLVENGGAVEHGNVLRLTIGAHRPERTLVAANTDAEASLLDDFAKVIVAGGGAVEAVPNIQPLKYRKNLWNVSFATTSTLIRSPLPSFFANKETEARITAVLYGVLEEAISIARALGYSEEVLSSSLIQVIVESMAKVNRPPTTNTHRPSMLVDVETGKPLELEVIIGQVVKWGREYNLSIPRLETIYGLLSVVQNDLVNGK